MKPSCPRLGALPGVVFDPAEALPDSIVEVKCPYRLKGKSVHGMGDLEYMKRNSHGTFKFDRSHDYYHQVLRGDTGLGDRKIAKKYTTFKNNIFGLCSD